MARVREGSTSNSPSAKSASVAKTSCGMSRCTGPGRPVSASRNAVRISSGIRPGSATTAFHFVTGANRARLSRSMNMPTCGYEAARCWLVVIARTARLLLNATPMPDARLSPPGPISPSATAIAPVRANTPAAIIGPAPSWRTPTYRIDGVRAIACNSAPIFPPATPNANAVRSASRHRTRACAPVSFTAATPRRTGPLSRWCVGPPHLDVGTWRVGHRPPFGCTSHLSSGHASARLASRTRCFSCLTSAAVSPRVSAAVAFREPIGRAGPTVLSRAV